MYKKQVLLSLFLLLSSLLLGLYFYAPIIKNLAAKKGQVEGITMLDKLKPAPMTPNPWAPGQAQKPLANLSPFGVNIHSGDDFWQKTNPATYPSLADLLSGAGVKWVRVFVTWQSFELTKDTWNEPVFSKFKVLLDNLYQQRLAIDVVVTNPPLWATEPGVGPRKVDAAQWEQFIAELIKRLPPAYISAWEIENEASDKELYILNKESLVDITKRSYNLIKQNDPSDIVLLSSFVPINKSKDIITYWLIQAQGSYDVLNMHQYAYEDQKVLDKITLFNSFITAAKLPKSYPIWLTETNICSTALGTDCRDPVNGGVKLKSRYNSTLAVPGIAKVFWFKETTQMWGPGLLSNPQKEGAVKYEPHQPIYKAYQELTSSYRSIN